MLRAATAAKILDGWQGPHVTARSYCIAPSTGGAMECPLDYVIGYCKMLALAGVEPLYRESEPRRLNPETRHEL
ncbi:MAG: hypothetical protein ACTHMY_00520 [Solirubrobacteraceae bacterium]